MFWTKDKEEKGLKFFKDIFNKKDRKIKFYFFEKNKQ